MTDPAQRSSSKLRKFGTTMAVPLALLSGLAWWRESPAWVYLLGLAALFSLLALAVPRALWPVEWVWMKFARWLSVAMTYMILTLTFYLVITPMGLLMRLFGKDPMERKFEPEKKSYWIPVQPDGPHTRPDKPF